MIKWTDIDEEVEEFQNGYRAGFVSIFKKYEGQETDERTAQNKVVVVTAASFSSRYGIRDATFRDWLRKEDVTEGVDDRTSQRYAKHIEKVRGEEQAKAQTALAAALAEQERKAKAQAEQVRAEAERAKREALAKAEQEKKAFAVKAKAEAEAEAKTKLEKIEKQLRAEIKAEPPTDEVLAEMAKNAFNSNDPDIVAKMSEAYGKHRAERDAKAKSDAKSHQAAARAQKAEDDAKRAANRASKEYEDSALFQFIEETYPSAIALDRILSTKPITMSNLHASGYFEGQIRDMCDEVAEIAKRVEAQVLETMLEVEVN